MAGLLDGAVPAMNVSACFGVCGRGMGMNRTFISEAGEDSGMVVFVESESTIEDGMS